MDVGIRELRNSLSRYLDEVKAGETVTVTDRGRPIARLVPIDEVDPLEELIRQGRVTPAKLPKEDFELPAPIVTRGSVVDLLIQERRERDY